MTVRQAVTELPKAKPELVTAQIHDAESDVMEVRLEDKRLIAQYAEGKKEFVVDPTTPSARRTTCGWWRPTAASTSSTTANPAGSIAQSGTGWYFKTGSYLQSNTEKGATCGRCR